MAVLPREKHLDFVSGQAHAMFTWEVVASCDLSLVNDCCAQAGMVFLGMFLKEMVFPDWGIPDFAGILRNYETN